MLYLTRVKGEPLQIDKLHTISDGVKPFIILYGASGSGKSHTAQELCDEFKLDILSYHVIMTEPVNRYDHGAVSDIRSCRVPKHRTVLNGSSSRAHLLVVTDKCFILDPCGNESAATLSIGRGDQGWTQMQRINQDLLALRRFIDAMQGSDHTKPIPWRESALNKLLYEYKLHQRNIICIGCLNGTVSDSNTISFMRSIGYLPERITKLDVIPIQTEFVDKIIELQKKIYQLSI